MSIINISKTKLIGEIHQRFPKLRTPENYADVLLAGVSLFATDSTSGKTRWQFVNAGAKPHSFSEAYKKYGLLDRKEAPRVRILRYTRGTAPKGNSALKQALDYERKGLYTHLTISPTARNTVAIALNVRSYVSPIRDEMEKGSIMQQIDTYDKILSLLQIKGQYNKSYNYVMLGFRYLPDKYWLSDLAERILAKC